MPYKDKEAGKAYDVQYRLKNKEKIKERQRKWYSENRVRVINSVIANRDKRWYGISSEDYNYTLSVQNFCCAICGRDHMDIRGRRLCVDHDHETGKFRGLLCDLCNKGLGQFRDNIEVLEKAIEYLRSR